MEVEGQLADRGWIIVDLWDKNALSDKQIGRVVLPLQELEKDHLYDDWHGLQRAPGQTWPKRPWPSAGPKPQQVRKAAAAARSELKLRLLMHSRQQLSEKVQWLQSSRDFVEIHAVMISKDLWASERCHLEWHLHQIVVEAFSIFDVDGDGTIDPTELQHVMTILGEEMSFDELASFIAEALVHSDPNMTEDDIGSELAIYTGTPGCASLDFQAFKYMLTDYWTQGKYSVQKPGHSFLDSRASETDEPQAISVVAKVASQPSGCHGHCCHQPRNIKGRDLTDSALPTPAWMRALAATHEPMPSEKRVPENFWYFLRRKLEKVLLLHKSYGVEGTDFLFRRIDNKQSVFDPGWSVRNIQSTFSLCWDMVQVLFLAYVSVSVPMQVGFDLTIDVMSFIWMVEVMIDTYFVLDILINFRTPFIDMASGELRYSSAAMAMNYAKGWCLIDIFSCISVLQYVFLIIGQEGGDAASTARLTKTLRLLRLAKLLRLARVRRLINRLPDDVIAVLAPAGNVMVMLLGIIFAMHIISCFWYLAGTATNEYYDGNTTHITIGWVEAELQETWGGRNASAVPFPSMYLSSLYAIMIGEFPDRPTHEEKGFALLGVIVNSFIYGAVAATLSSIMVALRAPSAEYNIRLGAIRNWMRSKHLNWYIREQVESFYDSKISDESNVVVDEFAILQELYPSPIAFELVQKLYAGTINKIPIFAKLEEEVIVKLCLALRPLPALAGAPVVRQGFVGEEMYIVNDGKLQVWHKEDTSPVRAECSYLGNKFWVSVHGTGSSTQQVSVRIRDLDLYESDGKTVNSRLRHRALRDLNSTVQGTITIQVQQGFDGRPQNLRHGFFVDFDPAKGSHNWALQNVDNEDQVQVLQLRKGRVVGYLTAGEYFGEGCLDHTHHYRHERSVSAVTNTNMCYLHKDEVMIIADSYPELWRQLERSAAQRRRAELPRELFNSFDQDSDGILETDELRKLLMKLQFSADDIDDEIKSMYWGSESEVGVSYEEFSAWWLRYENQRRGTARRRWRAAGVAVVKSAAKKLHHQRAKKSGLGFNVLRAAAKWRRLAQKSEGSSSDSDYGGSDDDNYDSNWRRGASRSQPFLDSKAASRLEKRISGIEDHLGQMDARLASLAVKLDQVVNVLTMPAPPLPARDHPAATSQPQQRTQSPSPRQWLQANGFSTEEIALLERQVLSNGGELDTKVLVGIGAAHLRDELMEIAADSDTAGSDTSFGSAEGEGLAQSAQSARRHEEDRQLQTTPTSTETADGAAGAPTHEVVL